ncbi:hypothetical protein ACO0LM_22195 [Undibacterium sp. Di26W]|uniref:hypothetical protein n=1 Tax=Undibacterium sp. Di26W TaxID=3413035 RepID=UPI003BF0E652
MSNLPFTMHSKKPIEDRNIFIFGKPPELYSTDFKSGLARIGGPEDAWLNTFSLAHRVLNKILLDDHVPTKEDLEFAMFAPSS